MGYISLGARGPLTGDQDATDTNPGSWSVVCDPETLDVDYAQFEIYKVIVKGVFGARYDIYVNDDPWHLNLAGSDNSFEPINALILGRGQTVFFRFTNPVPSTDNAAPEVTIWLRYDPGVN